MSYWIFDITLVCQPSANTNFCQLAKSFASIKFCCQKESSHIPAVFLLAEIFLLAEYFAVFTILAECFASKKICCLHSCSKIFCWLAQYSAVFTVPAKYFAGRMLELASHTQENLTFDINIEKVLFQKHASTELGAMSLRKKSLVTSVFILNVSDRRPRHSGSVELLP